MGRQSILQQLSKRAAAAAAATYNHHHRLQICRGQHKFSLAKLRGSSSAASVEDQRSASSTGLLHTADSYNPHLQQQDYAWTPAAASHYSSWKPESGSGLWSPDQLKQQQSSAAAQSSSSVLEDVHLYHQCDHRNVDTI